MGRQSSQVLGDDVMMALDAYTYCLPERLRDPQVALPQMDAIIHKTIYKHQESALALLLSSMESILNSMNESQISQSVIYSLPWRSPELCRENNNYLLEACAKDNRLIPVCSV